MSILERLKRGMRRVAARRGYTIASDWRLGRLPQQRYLARLFTLLQVDCVLDVGANRGQFRDFLRDDVGYEGAIVSFEPLPDLAGLLARKAAADPHWFVHPYALGSRAEQRAINVMAEDPFSSFFEPIPVVQFEHKNRVQHSIEVTVRTLDEVAPELQAARPFSRPYLKVDTQGFDQEVLRGASTFLEQTPALQFEAAVVPLYVGSPDFAGAIRNLEQRGFSVSAIFPNNPEHFPRMIEFDCHMVRLDMCGEASA